MNAQDRTTEDIAFLERVMRFQDSALNSEETAALEREMMASPEKRRLFTGAQLLSTSIHEWLRQEAYRPAERPQRVAWLAWLSRRPLMAAAACLVFMAILGAVLFLPQTSAAAIVRRALKTHAAALDRCYRVQVRGEHDSASPPRQESLLWTRGDRFWIQLQAAGKTVAWGRDESGGVWFALSPTEGARLDADEVPEQLALACELRSLEVESLLQSILAGFELRREPANAGGYVIHAELKPGRTHPKYHSALLEVDAQSGVLRRVVLHRAYRGRPVAVVSFAFVEATLNDEASYTLAGHLAPDATIYDRKSGRGKRLQLIAKLLRLRLFPAQAPNEPGSAQRLDLPQSAPGSQVRKEPTTKKETSDEPNPTNHGSGSRPLPDNDSVVRD
ncbi:MAG: hypothetical protein FJ395_03955 [Verrucomicrobia bacterium]|nr:hypothetical protein [Verrucomicrobiota bacterium]